MLHLHANTEADDVVQSSLMHTSILSQKNCIRPRHSNEEKMSAAFLPVFSPGKDVQLPCDLDRGNRTHG